MPGPKLGHDKEIGDAMPVKAFVFDAYGTLFDVHAAINRHRAAVGEDADRFSDAWRAKQLEYSWTLTLMGRYESFWTLTERALDFAFARFPKIDRKLRAKLLEAYFKLDAYPDARPTLTDLKAAGFATSILSNGSADMLAAAVAGAGLRGLLDHVLSVDAVRAFKPPLRVYDLALNALHASPGEIGFVSSNRWDVAGAANAGLKPIWVNRAGNPDEYLELAPLAVIRGLSEISKLSL
jgi:2-haloacid dehalogenase